MIQAIKQEIDDTLNTSEERMKAFYLGAIIGIGVLSETVVIFNFIMEMTADIVIIPFVISIYLTFFSGFVILFMICVHRGVYGLPPSREELSG